MGLSLGEIHARVRSQMGDLQTQVFTPAEITYYSNDWLRMIAARVPAAFWTTTTFSTVNGTRTYNLATDWIRMKRVVYNDTDVLPAATIDQLHQITSDFDQSGTPRVYYIQRTPTGGSSQVTGLVGLWPVPTSAVTIRYWYEYMPSVLTNPSDRMPLPPGMDDSVIPFVCYQLKKKDREPTEAAMYKREFDEGFAALVRYLTERPDAHWQMQEDSGELRMAFARFDPTLFESP